jgi:hypothetical protein
MKILVHIMDVAPTGVVHMKKIIHEIVSVLIHSSLCVVNFILSECRPNLAEVTCPTSGLEQASSNTSFKFDDGKGKHKDVKLPSLISV